jgi:hypothetical protein
VKGTWKWKRKVLERRKWIGHTVDDPFFDLGRRDLERFGDLRVREVLPNVFEPEGGERQKADFTF